MDKKMGWFSRIIHSRMFPFFLMVVLEVAIHAFMNTTFYDDPNNRQRVADYSNNPILAAWSVYQVWSSRLVIESVYFTLLSIPQVVWKVCDALIYVLFAYSASQLINIEKDRKLDCAIICITLIFPIWKMSAAGWIGTSNNYIWTAAFGLYATIPWSKYLYNQRVPIQTYILGTLAFIYAINHEQFLALMIGLLIVFMTYCLVTKRQVSIYVVFQFLLCIGMAIFVMTAPGNKSRAYIDVHAYMPTFHMYSFVQRLYMMFMYTSKSLIIDNGICFFLMSLLLFFVPIIKRKELYVLLTASVPLVVALIFGPLQQASQSVFPPMQALDTENYFLIQDSLTSHQYVLLIIYLCVYFSIFITLFFNIENKRTSMLAIIVLCGGFATRLIMAAEATMLASGDRTASFLYYCVLFVAGLLTKEIFDIGNKKSTLLTQFALYLFAALSVISTFLYL